MTKHKYPLGSLVLAKRSNALGYIQEHTENFYGDLYYSIYWFKDQYVSHSVGEKQVEDCIKWYKEKYERT